MDDAEWAAGFLTVSWPKSLHECLFLGAKVCYRAPNGFAQRTQDFAVSLSSSRTEPINVPQKIIPEYCAQIYRATSRAAEKSMAPPTADEISFLKHTYSFIVLRSSLYHNIWLSTKVEVVFEKHSTTDCVFLCTGADAHTQRTVHVQQVLNSHLTPTGSLSKLAQNFTLSQIQNVAPGNSAASCSSLLSPHRLGLASDE